MKSQGFCVPQDSPRAGSHLQGEIHRTPHGVGGGREAVFWGWVHQLSVNQRCQPCSEHSGRNGAGGRDRGSPSWWGTSLLDRTVCNCGGPVKRTGSLLKHKSHRFPTKGAHSETRGSAGSLPRTLCAVTHLSYSARKSRVFSRLGTTLPRCSPCCGPCLFICQRAKRRTHPYHCLSTWAPPPPTLVDCLCTFPLYVQQIKPLKERCVFILKCVCV